MFDGGGPVLLEPRLRCVSSNRSEVFSHRSQGCSAFFFNVIVHGCTKVSYHINQLFI
jgi:hypothetical protein